GGVMSAIVAGGCTTLSAPSAAPKGEGGAMFVYVGCYTTKQRNARGEGINVYSMDRTSGIWTHVQLVKDLVNPSWLALDQQQRVLYSAHGDGEVVTALSIDRSTGQLKMLGQQATGGKNGVRIAVDSTNKFLVCANYSSGTVAVLPIAPDGSLGPLTDLVSLTGTPGPHRTEQSSPHPHDVPFEPSGRFVYGSNRGHDSIAVFAVDAGTGVLTPVDWEPTQGKTPRFFTLDPSGRYLYAANQDSDTIVCFRVDPGSGKLSSTGNVVKTGSPSSIVFV